MNKTFLKDNWVLYLVYVIAALYLITGVTDSYSFIAQAIHDHAYFAILLLFIQLILWKIRKIKILTFNRIIAIISLFLINFYFLIDARVLYVPYFIDSEAFYYLLLAGAAISGVIIFLQIIGWVIYLLLLLLKNKTTSKS